ARLANALLGTGLEPPTLSAPAARQGFWGRAEGVARDGAFWRQQAYLLQGVVLRGVLAICEVTLLAAGAMALAVPVYYRWSPPDPAGPRVGACRSPRPRAPLRPGRDRGARARPVPARAPGIPVPWARRVPAPRQRPRPLGRGGSCRQAPRAEGGRCGGRWRRP